MRCQWWFAPPLDIPFRCNRTDHSAADQDESTFHSKRNFRWTESSAGARKRRTRR